MLVNSRLIGELRDSDGRVRYNDIYYLQGFKDTTMGECREMTILYCL